MITNNLSTLTIHKLTQAQYDRAVANGTIDENALYLTPDEEVDLSLYMTKNNPVCTGSLSLDRMSGTTVGTNSVALGTNVTASAGWSFAQGYNTSATAQMAFATGGDSVASGSRSFASGYKAQASGSAAHAEGYNCSAVGDYSHAEGYQAYTNEQGSHAEGVQTYAMEIGSHAEGGGTQATGYVSHAEGYYAKAQGDYSHAAGYYTTADQSNYVIGHYNKSGTAGSTSGTTGDAFIIGKGTSSSGSNAFRVTYAGKAYGQSSFGTSGADYAEFFEWLDSNPNAEDRRGYFVTLDGDKIKIAEPNDYILGIVSALPAIIGNNDEEWRGRYILDEFGAFIVEEFEYEEEIQERVIDEKTGEVTLETKTVTKTGTRYKENPDYDPTLPYIQREDRPEWDTVGMMGVLAVRDDGTCHVNGYCKVAEGGIATASKSGYRVIQRVNENIVKVVFR